MSREVSPERLIYSPPLRLYIMASWPPIFGSGARSHLCGEHYEVLRGRRVLGQIQLSMGHRRRGGLGCWHSSITRGECLPTATRLPEKLP